MKKLSFVSFLLFSATCFSQSFNITVLNKNSVTLPYAYILVNDKPIAVCDSMGLAIIPLNKIQIMDTLSVSYVGAIPTEVIIDETIRKQGSYIFYLEESEFYLNEAIVSYENYQKLFKKNTRFIQLLRDECNLEANLQAEISTSNFSYSGSGKIIATNSREYPRYFNWFNPPIKFETNSDTSKIWRALNYSLHLALNQPYLSLWAADNEKRVKGIYTYMGEKDNLKAFRIIYPKNWFKDMYYQIMVFVDKESKYIKSIEIKGYTDDSKDDALLSIKFDCIVYRNKRESIYLPDNIDYQQTSSYNMRTRIKISNIQLK
jgi:hypothetical protein